MAPDDTDSARVIGRFLRRVDRMPPFALLECVRLEAATEIADARIDLLVADYSATSFERLGGSEVGESGEALMIDDSLAGRAYIQQEIAIDEQGDTSVVYLPVSAQGERMGVMEVVLEGHADEARLGYLRDIALAVAYTAAVSERHTDLFARLRRRRNLDLAAELQWQLLPALTQESPRFKLAGWLEPAYEVAGDNFDFSVDAGRLTLSVVDGVGHGVMSGLLTSLAVTALRNERRHGNGLVEQATSADRAVHEHIRTDQFVTGTLMGVDLSTGAATVVNAGHPLIRIVRDGEVRLVEVAPNLPFGIYGNAEYREQPVELHPGDRVVLLSDGVLEAGGPDGGEPFGAQDLDELLLLTRDLSSREMVRRVTIEVGRIQQGRLRDDATVVCLDWLG